MLRKRLYVAAVTLCLVVTLMPVVPALAGDSVQLTGKAQIEFVSVSLETTDTLDYGNGAPGQTVTRSFTARNNGSLTADWDLIGTDATAAGDDAWQIGSACGANQFVWEAQGTGLNQVKLCKTWMRLADGVPAGATRDVNLAFTFPSSSNNALVHSAVATLRATGSGGSAPTAQSVSFDNTEHETLTAAANRPLNVTFVPSTMGCAANIHFTSGTFAKTSSAGENVTYHSDGLSAGTYQWKCSMMDCCYGTLVVE